MDKSSVHAHLIRITPIQGYDRIVTKMHRKTPPAKPAVFHANIYLFSMA
jgi:hypothetical protein